MDRIRETGALPARPDRVHLLSVLSIVLCTLFVAMIVVFTGDLATYWSLFLLPVVMAAMFYGVPGSVLVTAVSAAIAVMALPDALNGTPMRAELLVGFITFLACGIVVGIQSSRSRWHSYELEQASERDRVTGLYKAAYMRARLTEEVLRAARHEADLGLVLARVDDLQGFGSKYGSFKATLLIEHMADIVRIAVRETDIVGRYAEDTFGIIAPFATAEESALVAQRVRATVADAEFEGDVLEPTVRSSVSVASASFPEDARDVEELIETVEAKLGLRTEELGSPAQDGGGRLGEVTSTHGVLS